MKNPIVAGVVAMIAGTLAGLVVWTSFDAKSKARAKAAEAESAAAESRSDAARADARDARHTLEEMRLRQPGIIRDGIEEGTRRCREQVDEIKRETRNMKNRLAEYRREEGVRERAQARLGNEEEAREICMHNVWTTHPEYDCVVLAKFVDALFFTVDVARKAGRTRLDALGHMQQACGKFWCRSEEADTHVRAPCRDMCLACIDAIVDAVY